jgi:hypothetical protein
MPDRKTPWQDRVGTSPSGPSAAAEALAEMGKWNDAYRENALKKAKAHFRDNRGNLVEDLFHPHLATLVLRSGMTNRMDLSGLRLEGRALGRNFSASRLRGATLVNMDLRGSRWVGSDLRGATFRNCLLDNDMSTALMDSSTKFENCNFANATVPSDFVARTTVRGGFLPDWMEIAAADAESLGTAVDQEPEAARDPRRDQGEDHPGAAPAPQRDAGRDPRPTERQARARRACPRGLPCLSPGTRPPRRGCCIL